jgi:hypothetical protein
MMIGTSGRRALALGKSSRPLISGIVDIRKDRDEGYPCRVEDALKCGGTGLGKLHSEPSAAKATPEVLTKQHLDIRLVVSTTRMRPA